jgi:hypothetical protein
VTTSLLQTRPARPTWPKARATLLLAAALLVAWPAGAAPPASGVPPEVESVSTGGYWQAEGRSGQYRVVTLRQGFDAVSNRLLVEWVAGPASPEAAPEVMASAEVDLGAGQALGLVARLYRVTAGCARITVQASNPMMPGEPGHYVVWATAPNQLLVASAARSRPPPGCSNKKPAAARP